MPNTRVKICGITRPEDAAKAAEAGADAIGLNFLAGPRRIAPELARLVIGQLLPLVTPVALISSDVPDSPQPYEIYRAMRVFVFQLYAAAPNWQFHENETAYWWVRHMDSRAALTQLAVDWALWTRTPSPGGQSSDWRVPRLTVGAKPEAIVLDAACKSALGGTGQAFDWHWIAEARSAGELDGLPPIILAGGLTPDNVADAIRIVHPYAVDVSSGVEVPGKPGIKDPITLRDFIQAAKGA